MATATSCGRDKQDRCGKNAPLSAVPTAKSGPIVPIALRARKAGTSGQTRLQFVTRLDNIFDLLAICPLIVDAILARYDVDVAESQPWSVAEWAVALRFNNPRATVPVLLLG